MNSFSWLSSTCGCSLCCTLATKSALQMNLTAALCSSSSLCLSAEMPADGAGESAQKCCVGLVTLDFRLFNELRCYPVWNALWILSIFLLWLLSMIEEGPLFRGVMSSFFPGFGSGIGIMAKQAVIGISGFRSFFGIGSITGSRSNYSARLMFRSRSTKKFAIFCNK